MLSIFVLLLFFDQFFHISAFGSQLSRSKVLIGRKDNILQYFSKGTEKFHVRRLSYLFSGTKSEENVPKLDYDEDYYSVLEVSPNADTKALKKAYYRMVFQYHPDNKEGETVKELCNRQMMVINNAYKVLRDEKQREIYDRKRRLAQQSINNNSNERRESAATSWTSSPFSSWSGRKEKDQPPLESMSDILSELFADLAFNKGNKFISDINDFLERQVVCCLFVWFR